MKAFVKQVQHLNHGGYGNGYVVLPPEHPYHGRDYEEIPVPVHGGLTFAESADNLNWEELDEGDKGGWVIGFDTKHMRDNLDNWPKESVLKETAELKDKLEQAWQLKKTRV
jgi:hypothetical protein